MFELAMPWTLLFFPLPWLIWFLVPKISLKLPTALRVPFYQALSNIVESGKHHGVMQGKISLLFLIWFLLLFALAGPRWVGEPEPLTREGYDIILALDISGSMELSDMMMHGRPATRLSVVKRAAEQFVKQRNGDKIGLILFGSQAYLQTPLTYDRHSVLMRIEDATVGLAGKTTSIGDAIGLAVKRLENVPAKGRVIILLTDGVNNSGVLAPLKAAELAALDHIKVYTIGLGSDGNQNMGNGLFFNMNMMADLDEDTLKEVAKITGGRYFRATDSQSLQSIYTLINQMETNKDEDALFFRPQQEYYFWFVAVAILLFFYWLSDRGGLLSLKVVKRSEVSR